jgi:hypothetical protein
MRRARKVIVHCGAFCRVVRHLPFLPHHPGMNRKIVKHWPLVIGGMAAFSVGIFLIGHSFTAGLVAARTVEAIGDLLFDRGIADEV